MPLSEIKHTLKSSGTQNLLKMLTNLDCENYQKLNFAIGDDQENGSKNGSD